MEAIEVCLRERDVDRLIVQKTANPGPRDESKENEIAWPTPNKVAS